MIINELLVPSSPVTAFLEGLAVPQIGYVAACARRIARKPQEPAPVAQEPQAAVQAPLPVLETVGQG